MSALGPKRTVFLKTYGKQRRRVDQWFSPDVRRKAFSFSTTPSSDPSPPPSRPPAKRRVKASRRAKKRALCALREPDSDEENLPLPVPPARRKTSSRQGRKDVEDSLSGGSLLLSHNGRSSAENRNQWRFVTRRRGARRPSPRASPEWAGPCEHPLLSSMPSVAAGGRGLAVAAAISSFSGDDSGVRDPQLHPGSQAGLHREGSPSASAVAPPEEPDPAHTTPGRPPEGSGPESTNPRFALYLSPSPPRPSPPRPPSTDRLEMECLTSCPLVSLRPLSPYLLLRLLPDERPREAPPTAVVAAPSSAPPARPERPRERPRGPGTTRKAGISGLGVNRWSRRGADGVGVVGGGNSSLNYLAAGGGGGVEGDAGGSMWPAGPPTTPLRADLDLSYVLATFSPDALTTQSWGRLKAALSVHKKKTAVPTPRRLAMSGLASPGTLGFSLDRSGASPGPEGPSDAQKVYHECRQDGPIAFQDRLPPERLGRCVKIGEGTFGEVFSAPDHACQTVALKVIPVEGRRRVNGEAQKSFGEILHEIIISKELSMLSGKQNNMTSGFIGLNNLHCVRGRYPPALLSAWDRFDREKGSENDRPDFFDDEQLFVVLEFKFGGSDLENMRGKLSSLAQATSVLHQVTAALAVAEQALRFEHRDLHWGNVLVRTTKDKRTAYVLDGVRGAVETRGLHVSIIDYSLSRLEIDGLTVSCDIADDEELFMGRGDYQFDIYRLMRAENRNSWSTYHPHSNVLWLHYLVDKLLSMEYRSKRSGGHLKLLRSFQAEILSYTSATDALSHCALFN